ncbi:MAG: FmdB family zinc ribbon protein [bacterium]
MPTYEYECLECGANFERFQSITARPLRRCPSCGKGKVRRLIGSGAGVLFRGSGFYETDYRSEEYKSKAKAESSGDDGKGSKKPSKKDSKGSSTSKGDPKPKATS